MQNKCPQCGKNVEYSITNEWRPFCCERCKLIDLGGWIEEKNRISDSITFHDYQEENINDLKH